DEPRRPGERGEVHHAAAADAVAAEHAHPVAGDEVEHPGVRRAEQVVVVEVLALQPGPALEYGHLRAAGRQVVGRDRAAEAAADHDDIGAFGAHARLPVSRSVSGWRLASSMP